ncbi:hypothetical protein ACFPFP_04420 [Bradyrhizobium sp. GCM10023182]|uniref:Uncharacterized protein n=1 Tax=Bradyrhizobium zhengyangense TaxID=2911009 RepID=A0ABS9LGN2_9BRAD|nr:hypothetical protein [Bradyrhizobium zhengyangense]MCG2666171.1 hypothetical protein [Bradyrhizobium zhengyangense]
MAIGPRERRIAAFGAIAAAILVLAVSAEYFTPGKPKLSTVYQLVLITLAGNWNPADVDPNWNAVTAAVALLLNLASLLALFKIFQFVSGQQERSMKAIDLLDIFNDLVTAKVSSEIADEFHIEGDAEKGRLNDVVAKAVKSTKDLWVKRTVPHLLNKEDAQRFIKSLDEKY